MKNKYCTERLRSKVEQEDGERFAVFHKVRESFTRKVALNKNLIEVRKQTILISGKSIPDRRRSKYKCPRQELITFEK